MFILHRILLSSICFLLIVKGRLDPFISNSQRQTGPLHLTYAELAKRLNVSLTAASYAVARGEAIVRDKGYKFIAE